MSAPGDPAPAAPAGDPAAAHAPAAASADAGLQPPSAERRGRRWAWPVALLGTLAVVLGLRLFVQQGQAGTQALAGSAAPAASGASGAAAGVAAALAETSPQLAQATQTAARVARATTAALAAVTQGQAQPAAAERSLELCGLGRLSLPLSTASPGNAASRLRAVVGSGAGGGAGGREDGDATSNATSDTVSDRDSDADSDADSGADGASAGARPLAVQAIPALTTALAPAWAAPAGLPLALGALARADAWPELLAALEAPGQPTRAQAAALVLRLSEVEAADRLAAVPATSASAASAPALAPAPVAAAREERLAQARALDRLARLARPVVRQAGQPPQGDATVLRWALALCARDSRPSAECRRLSARDLVRLAPEDSASWLVLARRSGLPARERQAALVQAAQAPQFTALGTALALQLDAVWPAQRPGYLRLQMLALAQAVERRLDEGGLPTVLQACSAQALAAERSADSAHAVCEGLARQMQQRGPDLAWLAAAATLGQRLGWAEPERRALRREQVALTALQAAPAAVVEQPLSCPALAWTRGQLRGSAEVGELGWLRQRRAGTPAAPAPAQGEQAAAVVAPEAGAAPASASARAETERAPPASGGR